MLLLYISTQSSIGIAHSVRRDIYHCRQNYSCLGRATLQSESVLEN